MDDRAGSLRSYAVKATSRDNSPEQAVNFFGLCCEMLIDSRAVDAMAASVKELEEEATTAASNASRNVET